MILGLQLGLKDDGIEVSLVKLCEWFAVARRSVCCQATKGQPKLQEQFVRLIKAMIEENPSFGSDDGAFAGLQQEHGATDVPTHGLAGVQAPGGLQDPHPGAAVCGPSTKRALGDGLVQKRLSPQQSTQL